MNNHRNILMFSDTHHTEFSMKKFFTLIALTCAFVPAIYGMESVSELKSLKRSCDVIDLTNDAVAPLVTKKQKIEENNKAVANNGLAKKIVYGAPVAKQTMLNFDVEHKVQFVQAANKIKSKAINPKKSHDNPFDCLECGKAFPTKRSLASHKGGHTAMKRANKVLLELIKQDALLMKIKNEQLK